MGLIHNWMSNIASMSANYLVAKLGIKPISFLVANFVANLVAQLIAILVAVTRRRRRKVIRSMWTDPQCERTLIDKYRSWRIRILTASNLRIEDIKIFGYCFLYVPQTTTSRKFACRLRNFFHFVIWNKNASVGGPPPLAHRKSRTGNLEMTDQVGVCKRLCDVSVLM